MQLQLLLLLLLLPAVCSTNEKKDGMATCGDKVITYTEGAEYNVTTGKLACKKPKSTRLVYSPGTVPDKPYKVVFATLECINSQWQAFENISGMVEARPIWQGGDVVCEYTKTKNFNCADTRLDYNNMAKLNDSRLGAVNPIRIPDNDNGSDYHYECNNTDLIFFYMARLGLEPMKKNITRERPMLGRYLTSGPKCKEGVLNTTFARDRNQSAKEIPHVGSFTCKPFSCLDSLDPPLTWLVSLGLGRRRDETEQQELQRKCGSNSKDCLLPDLYAQGTPCGEKGHEMVVHEYGDRSKSHWLKDDFFACSKNGSLTYRDNFGDKHYLHKEDIVLCRIPEDCFELMTGGEHSTHGCEKRLDCLQIKRERIQSRHQTAFDGYCSRPDYVLKIVGDNDTDFSKPAVELKYVYCLYGRWNVTLLEDSITNPKGEGESEGSGSTVKKIELPVITAHTRFVCELRATVLQCPLPEDPCPDQEEKCKNVVLNNEKTGLKCNTMGTELIRIRKMGKRMKVEVVKEEESDFLCNLNTGYWTPSNSSGKRETVSYEGQSLACRMPICDSSNSSLPSECEKLDDHDGRSRCVPVHYSGLFTLEAGCKLPNYRLMMKEGTRFEVPIQLLHCSVNEVNEKQQWVYTDVRGVARLYEEKDNANFFCLDTTKIFKNDEPVEPDTSPQCRPTKLYSICEKEMVSCEPAKITNTSEYYEWKCPEGMNLTLVESEGKSSIINSIKCVANDPFWHAYQDAGMPFVPQPQSNFVCLLSTRERTDVRERATKMAASTEPTTKASSLNIEWGIGVPETILLVISLIILAAALAIYINTKRRIHNEYKKLRTEEEQKAH